ncbi:MAG: UvrD-helicase domain-containing protein [Porphyromonas sp.]|nr:UvrD-helicase domain-containing protein [Porphyromonas sp.]
MSLTIYKASAGSGKTYTLTREYLRLLLASDQKDYFRHILVATFTNKATKELRDRILRELHNASTNPGSGMTKDFGEELGISHDELAARARAALEAILNDYSAFRVQTIDSFFLEVVRSFALELSGSGNHVTADVELNPRLPIELSLDRLLLKMSAGEALYKWIEALLKAQAEEEVNFNVHSATSEIAEQFFYGVGRRILETDAQDYDLLISDYRKHLLEIRGKAYERRQKHLNAIRQWLDAVREVVERYDVDPLSTSYKFLPSVLTAREEEIMEKIVKEKSLIHGTVRKKIPEGKIKFECQAPLVEEAKEALLTCLSDLIEAEDSHYEAVRDELRIIYTIDKILLRYLDLIPILRDLWVELREYLHEERILLIGEINDLVKQVIGEDDIPFMYERIGSQIHHYLIDEFQDTNQVQWDNLQPLVEEAMGGGDESYLVGDLKQSIYRWRGASSEIMAGELSKPGTIEKTLETNYRSLKSVVEFNNDFFSDIYGYSDLYGVKDQDVASHQAVYESAEDAHNVRQEVASGNEEGGYVRIELYKEDRDEKDSQMREMLESLLIELQDKWSYRPGDIAILVRKGTEATKVANLLTELQHLHPEEAGKFDFTSSEALLVTNSPTVRLIVALFFYFSNSGDRLYEQKLSLVAWQQGLSGETLEALMGYRSSGDSIYDVALKVVQTLGELPDEELLYINSFLDLLYSYSSHGICTHGQFCKWWQEKGLDAKVDMGEEQQNRISILTIHSSKGLEFPVVVMPYTDWEISSSTTSGVELIELDDQRRASNELFDTDLSHLLIPSSTKRENIDSLLSDAYEAIREKDYFDDLNLLYVAFTRASEQLYVYAKEKPDSGIRRYVSSVIQQRLAAPGGSVNIYERGKPHTMVGPSKVGALASSGAHVKLTQIAATPQYDGLELTDLQKEEWETDEMALGTTLHALLATTYRRDDFAMALKATSLLSEEEKEQWRSNFELAFADPRVADWFDPDRNLILMEQDIVERGAHQRRPDRLVINRESGEVSIIDYKFGAPQPGYQTQVKGYMKLLHLAGYEKVKGYLWYQMKDIEEVQL